MHKQNMKKIISIIMVLVLLFSLQIPVSAEPSDGPYVLSGNGVYVEVDGSMSMTVYRVEADGSKTPMTQKIENINSTALTSNRTDWLPWSATTGSGTNDLFAGSAKLLSPKSGYVTVGTRTTGPSNVGNETAIDDFVAETSVLEEDVTTYFGMGDRLTVTGKSASANLTRILVIETSEDDPGVVSVTSKYRNDGSDDLAIARFVENNYKISDELSTGDYIANKREAGLWTQQGATVVWGMDYVMPVYATMGTRNTTVINAIRAASNDLVSRNNWFWSENGGLPFNDYWGTNVGILVGSAMPYMVPGMEIPTRGSAITGKNDTAYTWVGWPGKTIAAGDTVNAGTSIVGVHTGDNFTGSRQSTNAMSYISNLELNGTELPSDWFAPPDPNNYPEDAWGGTWESWGGGENFDPIEAINYVNDGTFKKFGIKYVVLDACWYPRGTSAGATLREAQRGGEGLYIAIPSKWQKVADYFGMPSGKDETDQATREALTKAVVKRWTDFMHENGFKTGAWVMPSSVYLQQSSSDGTWSAQSGANLDGTSSVVGNASNGGGSNQYLQITTSFTEEFSDYLITGNAAEYDPETGKLKEGSPKPWYRRQVGYYPQTGTADLCLGNPKVLNDYTDYFTNLIFEEYGFDGLKIDTQWGASVCNAIGHGHDGNPYASIQNYAIYWKTIYDKAKAILGEDPWMKHCCCGTTMNFFNNNGTNRPITGDPGSSNVRKARYSMRMWKGIYGDNATAVSDHVENFGRRAKSLFAAGYILESKFWPSGGNLATLTNEQCVKYFPMANVTEGLASGNYLDLYKFGFDYPEVMAYDNPKMGVRYYSVFASSAPVASFTSGSAYVGGGEATMNYTGPVELRGLTPGATYTVTDYEKDVVLGHFTAESSTLTIPEVNFTEVLMLKVTEDVVVESVKIDGAAIQQVRMRNTKQFTATVNPGDATVQTVTWESSNPKIFTVKDGLVTGLATGNAKLIVTASNGKTSFIMVQVTA